MGKQFKQLREQGKRMQASLASAKEYVVTPDQWEQDIGGNNRIIGPRPKDCSDVRIVFQGKNNILYLEKDIRVLKDTTITFSGNNAVAFLCSNMHDDYSMDMTLETDSLAFIGRNVFLNSHDPVRAVVCGGDSLFIGDECLFAQGVVLDTTREDVSLQGDIYIGNHVWIGQEVSAGPGTKIHGGAIIGARTVLRGEEIPGSSIWVTKDEAPVQLRENVMYAKVSVRNARQQNLNLFETPQAQYRETAQKLIELDHTQMMDEVRKTRLSNQRLERMLDYRKTMWHSTPVWDYEDDSAEERTFAENRIEGSYIDGGDVQIDFYGKGNILYIEDGVTLTDSFITFHGDNAVLFLGRSEHPYRFRVSLSNDSLIRIGRGCKFGKEGKRFRAIAGEAKSILIGDRCRIKRRVWIRTSDQHPIYDLETGKRINAARDVIIGDGAKLKRGTLLMKKSVGEDNAKLTDLLEKLQEKSDAAGRLEILKEQRAQDPD